jgi:hypothetical protein
MRAALGMRELASFLALAAGFAGRGSQAVEVGFGKADITPDLKAEKPVWIAGYGHNRRATGVHDPLYARAVVLKDASKKIALVSVDLVGFMYPNTKEVRKRLDEFTYVLVSSTHNHEGPDTIGLWGPSASESGVDPALLERVERGIIAAARSADAAAVPVEAEYGTAEDETLLRDTRLPIVKDGVIRVVRLRRKNGDGLAGLLVQWNCHPETLGSKNTLITADFSASTIAALEQRYRAPVAYFTGAVGGLMTGPRDRIKAKDGTVLNEGDYEYARVYGEEVAALAVQALAKAEPLDLAPVIVSAQPIAIPLANPGYRLGRNIGILKREGFVWTGDPNRFGAPVPDRLATGEIAMETEVAYVRLGDLHVAAIPGELYPELVYGQFQEPADPNADTPEAPLEPAVMKTLPGPKTLLFGLANDEVGYIIPKRQWDNVAPFAYGRTSKQYGEVNSVGPETAPILMQALQDRVREAAANGGNRPKSE